MVPYLGTWTCWTVPCCYCCCCSLSPVLLHTSLHFVQVRRSKHFLSRSRQIETSTWKRNVFNHLRSKRRIERSSTLTRCSHDWTLVPCQVKRPAWNVMSKSRQQEDLRRALHCIFQTSVVEITNGSDLKEKKEKRKQNEYKE